MNCLWCDQEITLGISWDNLIVLSKPQQLCEKCLEELEALHGARCQRCSRMTAEEQCSDCKQWSTAGKQDPLESNVSVFTYNEQMQAMIAKWKYRGDYILAEAFKSLFIESFIKSFSGKMKETVLVPIPLSQERLTERGFNQASVLANFLPMEAIDVITRIHSEKQAKKTRNERIFTENPFRINKKINKTAILVDDIYTTGTTLRHAASLLRAHGCPQVYAYTLIRG